MVREVLEEMLREGCSLEEIGRRVDRHPSTVSYWLRKHGLLAAHRERHASIGGVNRDMLTLLVQEGLSGRAIATRLGCSLATVRHWLGVYGLETAAAARRRALAVARTAGEREPTIECCRCGPTRHRFFPDRGYVCLACRSRAVIRRRRKVKEILVEEAGGACARCGFADSMAALQFHHLDPSVKEFQISRHGATRSIERARAEARKCILLCANCHAAVECGDAALP
jgi:transposase